MEQNMYKIGERGDKEWQKEPESALEKMQLIEHSSVEVPEFLLEKLWKSNFFTDVPSTHATLRGK